LNVKKKYMNYLVLVDGRHEMISIIVPVYNIEQYIEECVESVLAQDYQDYELILVDDGSIDTSGTICDRLQAKDRRIYVLHKVNGGLSSARNAGLDISNGEYVFFLDGDDRIPSDCLSNMLMAIEKSNSDLCVGDYIRFDTKDVDAHTNIDWNGIRLLEGRQIPDIYLNYGGYFVVAWNKLYRKKIFDNLCYNEGKVHEDEFLAHKIWKKCARICCIDNIVYHYRYTQNSIMNSKLTIKRLDSIEAYCDRIKSFRKDGHDLAAQNVEYLLWQDVRLKYFRVDSQENKKRMFELRKLIRKNWKYLMKNVKFTYKEKIAISIFCVNSTLYQRMWG
jgi:putative glycosyltransferase